MWLFYTFAALLLAQSAFSLRGGLRYLRFFRRELSHAPPDFTPRVSVIVPCRGLDQGLRENLSALSRQNYPAYELIFVTEGETDLARGVVEDLLRSSAARDENSDQESGPPTTPHERAKAQSKIGMRLVTAGSARSSGQKVHNLRVAVRQAHPASAVFVFVDTDARPNPDWLRSLVAPLSDEQVGAATGYRWFVPMRGNLASHLRAVWNASVASALGDDAHRNFCWGGSTAIRRETFYQLNILAEWRGTVSDDYVLTHTLQRARLPIRFVPRCLVASHEDCTWRQLFEFTTRQLKITRVYAPHLWRAVLASNLLFCAVFYGAAALAAGRALRGEPLIAPLVVVASAFALGTCKAHLRLAAVSRALAPGGVRLPAGTRLAHLTLWPAASALFLYNALAAALSRRITWRGITYELKSPAETVVISPARASDGADAGRDCRA